MDMIGQKEVYRLHLSHHFPAPTMDSLAKVADKKQVGEAEIAALPDDEFLVVTPESFIDNAPAFAPNPRAFH